MIPLTILAIIFVSGILIKSADMVIVAIRRLAKMSHARAFAISAVILAVGTSFPEMFVGITSALEGNPTLSLGDVTGSNIANLSLVVGLTAVIFGKVHVNPDFLRRDVMIALVAGVLPTILLFDGNLNRVDGLILLSVYAAYSTSFFRRRYSQIAKEQEEEESFVYRFMRQFNHVSVAKRREYGRFFVGLALMLLSADLVVRLAAYLAAESNIPKLVIGMVVIAVGTSLPEFAFSFRSVGDHEPSMFFGNLLGSTIANSTLIVGLVSVISPISVRVTHSYFSAAAAFIIIYMTFWYFIKSKHRLDRWEAFLLLVLYGGFLYSTFVS